LAHTSTTSGGTEIQRLVGITLGRFGQLIRSIEAALACASDQNDWLDRSVMVGGR